MGVIFFFSPRFRTSPEKKRTRPIFLQYGTRAKIPAIQVIYQTRETVFYRDIQTPRRELKIRRAAEYF